MRHLLCAFGGACVLLAASLLGQGHAVLLAQASVPPEFPSKVDLITVDAVVVDGSGNAVEGLTKDDFVLEEDGQPQEIVNFEAVSPADTTRTTAGAREPSPLATYSERPPGRAFAILADDLRLPGEQTLQLRRTITSFIERSLAQGDLVILGTTSGEAWWTAQMREGREDLLAVLNRVKGRYVDPSTREHMTEYEAFWITHREAGAAPITGRDTSLRPHEVGSLEALNNPTSVTERVALRLWNLDLCGHKVPSSDEGCFPLVKSTAADIDGARRQRTALTLRAMARAVDALAPYGGRRSILFLSPGFLQDEDLAQQEIASAALRAHTAVYFVDVRGLLTSGPSATVTNDLQSPERPSQRTQREMERRNVENGGALALAEETGGFSVRNTNDLAAAAARIAAESRTFYLLGFHPPAGKRANIWRKLHVTVSCSGVTVRARRGYRLDAARSSSPAGGSVPMPLRLASYILEPVAEEQTRVVVVTEVDVSSLAGTGRDESAPPLQLRLEATPREGGDTRAQEALMKWASPAGGPRGSSLAPDWRLARLEFVIPAGVHEIRASVRDPQTGRSGVVQQRIVVPEPSAFHLSTPVLSDQETDSRESPSQVYPAPVAHDRFTPKPGQPLRTAFEVFGAAKDAATGERSVEANFRVEDRAGRPLVAPAPGPLTPSVDGRLQLVLSLPPLPGGDYTLFISAEDRVTGDRQEVRRTFRVEAPALLAALPAAVALFAPAPGAGASMPFELAAILARAGQYVHAYGRAFSDILADEECQQVYQPDDPLRRTVRNTRAGAFFITLPGPLPWAMFKDVWEVDGNKVRDRQDRLGRLFHDSAGTAPERARAILEESARFNVGPLRRTADIPTLALLFLHPDNQRRFDFVRKGMQSIQATSVVEVGFREKGRPTLVAGNTSQGAPVKGSVWIDPERGTVLKTDADYDVDPADPYHRSHARIITEYRREASLGIFVPDRMKETYQTLAAGVQDLQAFRGAHARVPDAIEESPVLTVEATTLFSAYHRFEVTDEETFKAAPKKPQ